jgi:aryl-alcohol dehydrogenase-like predicted oxidoreductase
MMSFEIAIPTMGYAPTVIRRSAYSSCLASRFTPRFQGENFDKNLALVERVERMAEEKGCTPAQLALAWVLAQGDDVVPIPGTKRRRYLEENVGALAVALTLDDLDHLEELMPRGAAAGTRYPEEMMRAVNR